MPMRVAILCSDDSHHAFLQARLAAEFDVGLVVVEPAAAQRRALLRRRRFIDYAAYVYHAWRRRLGGLDAYRRGYFALSPETPLPTTIRHKVRSVNDSIVPELLRAAKPDVVVVMGTSILRPVVLEASGPAILNVHGGFLPHYRGNHCIFWALYDARHDLIGATIHFIDPGIDTGDIVEVVTTTVAADDSAETLYCRAERLAIERLSFWLRRIEDGVRLPRQPQSREGRAHRIRDRKPWHDVALWVRRRSSRRPPAQPPTDSNIPFSIAY